MQVWLMYRWVSIMFPQQSLIGFKTVFQTVSILLVVRLDSHRDSDPSGPGAPKGLAQWGKPQSYAATHIYIYL